MTRARAGLSSPPPLFSASLRALPTNLPLSTRLRRLQLPIPQRFAVRPARLDIDDI
jgi:hypothetical protein